MLIESKPLSPLGHALWYAALALFVIFTVAVIKAAVPFALLNPLWQMGLVQVLIDNAAIPAVGLALLHIGVRLEPGDRLLAQRRDTLAAWAVAATVGFLLLGPLQTYALVKGLQNVNSGQRAELARAERKINRMQSFVQKAASVRELQAGLPALEGPRLADDSLGLPLPVVRSRLLVLIEQVRGRLHDQLKGPATRDLWTLGRNTVAAWVSSLVLATGFAAMARRSGSERSFLQEILSPWQEGRRRLRHLRAHPRSEGRDGSAGPGHLQGLVGQSRTTPMRSPWLEGARSASRGPRLPRWLADLLAGRRPGSIRGDTREYFRAMSREQPPQDGPKT